jgi:hypothetical protein
MADQRPSDPELLRTFCDALNWTLEWEINEDIEIETVTGFRLTIYSSCRINLLKFLSQASS